MAYRVAYLALLARAIALTGASADDMHNQLRNDQFRHDHFTSIQAAFSRFSGQGVDGTFERQDLPNFVRFVVGSMDSAVPQNQLISRSSELTRQILKHLPEHKAVLTLADIMLAASKVFIPPPPPDTSPAPERERFGSKQLKLLRKRLERNRLTMPLFDTKGWVRDFEKSLKIQWEIYANGLSPMHIVVARSDRIYGVEPFMKI